MVYSFSKALVVQWIEQIRPKDKIEVRFLSRAQRTNKKIYERVGSLSAESGLRLGACAPPAYPFMYFFVCVA